MHNLDDLSNLNSGNGQQWGKWIAVKDLGPVDAVLDEASDRPLRRVEEEFRLQKSLAKHHLKPKRRLLFYGPPGNGKSFSARRLSKSLNLPLLIVPCSTIISSYMGGTGKRLHQLFAYAEMTPCVLLIDECDALGAARIEGGTNCDAESNRTVNTLLQLMEMTEIPGLVIFTTNFQKSLDSALFRRFDSVVRFDNPGPEERRRLIDTTIGKMKPKSFDLDTLAGHANGLSAALTINACSDAMKNSILQGANVVTAAAVEQEIRRIKNFQQDLLAI